MATGGRGGERDEAMRKTCSNNGTSISSLGRARTHYVISNNLFLARLHRPCITCDISFSLQYLFLESIAIFIVGTYKSNRS